MVRIVILSIGVAAAGFLFDTSSSEARVTSRGNPGRTYNIHGINYGSMKWERDRGYRRPLFKRYRRGFFRRR